MPERYMVTLNGVPLFCNLSRAEAEQRAEKWQGSYAKNTGLMKGKDHGDHVEVKRDHDTEREFDDAYDTYKRGKPQTYNYIMDGREDING